MKGTRKLRHLNVMNNTEHYESFMRDVKNSSRYLNGLIGMETYHSTRKKTFEPVHEISNNLVCATSKGSDQPAHTRRLIRAFASRLSIL